MLTLTAFIIPHNFMICTMTFRKRECAKLDAPDEKTNRVGIRLLILTNIVNGIPANINNVLMS